MPEFAIPESNGFKSGYRVCNGREHLLVLKSSLDPIWESKIISTTKCDNLECALRACVEYAKLPYVVQKHWALTKTVPKGRLLVIQLPIKGDVQKSFEVYLGGTNVFVSFFNLGVKIEHGCHAVFKRTTTLGEERDIMVRNNYGQPVIIDIQAAKRQEFEESQRRWLIEQGLQEGSLDAYLKIIPIEHCKKPFEWLRQAIQTSFDRGCHWSSVSSSLMVFTAGITSCHFTNVDIDAACHGMGIEPPSDVSTLTSFGILKRQVIEAANLLLWNLDPDILAKLHRD